MSVQPGPTDKRYAANGVSLTYTVPFLVIEAGDLQVFLNGVLLTSGYTHTGVGNPTGSITFVIPPAGDLYLLLSVPFQRLVDYQENGDFLSGTVNRDFDRIWQALKQLFGWANRSLRLGTFDVDGAGWYRAKGNGIINLASANGVDDAAANWKDIKDLLAEVLETGQGPINNAANIFYLDPDNNIFVVQDMSKSGPTKGANLLYLDDIRRHITFRSDDASGQAHGMHGYLETSGVSDTLLLEHVGLGPLTAGYGLHVLDSGVGSGAEGTGGGAIGGATSRTTDASAVVGNRRLTGSGHGGIFSRLESGQGNGVHGFRAGSGAGDGVFGYVVQTAQGHGVHGKHEGTVSGAGVFGERLNGAGAGPGVMGHAAGVGGAESASGYFFKQAADSAPAILADARGADSAIRSFTALSATARVLELQSDVTATAPNSVTIDRDYSLAGTNVRMRTGVPGGGARTGIIQGLDLSVAPGSASSGASAVYGISSLIGSSVTGSTDSRCANFNNNSIGGTDSYALLGVVNGANTRNYAVYGNAVGGTTNWSGYFVGNVFYGGTLTPSDSRLKDIHGEVDYAKCLENVLANPIYSYDKYSAWMEPTPVYGEVEDREGNLLVPTFGEHEVRQVVAVREVGNLAQDIQKTNPEFITEYSVGETRYLSVSDRSELFQLKAAVKYLVERLRENGVDV